MKTTKQYGAILISLALLLPTFAIAQMGAGVNASVQATTPGAQAQTTAGASATGGASAGVITRAKTKAAQEIDRRVAALNALSARVDTMTKVTPEFKQNLKTNVQAQISSLASLKVKIEGDADTTTLRTDVQAVTRDYRVFALVMPQARIAAAADREATIINMLAGIGTKLQARLQAAQQAGSSVEVEGAALADMGAKLQSAQTHAQAAVAGSATLTPDGGDKAKMDANVAALKTARAELKAAEQDILAARKDVDTIVKGLRPAAGAGASASSTVHTP